MSITENSITEDIQRYREVIEGYQRDMENCIELLGKPDILGELRFRVSFFAKQIKECEAHIRTKEVALEALRS